MKSHSARNGSNSISAQDHRLLAFRIPPSARQLDPESPLECDASQADIVTKLVYGDTDGLIKMHIPGIDATKVILHKPWDASLRKDAFIELVDQDLIEATAITEKSEHSVGVEKLYTQRVAG